MPLSFLILTKNESGNLPTLVAGIRRTAADLHVEAEVVVVDGSSDDTPEVAAALGCRVVRQPGDGFGDAFRMGLQTVSGDYIVTLDADGSHPPHLVRHLWALRHRADIVVGARYVPGGRATMPLGRALLSRLLNRLFARVLDLSISDLSSGYRLYRRSALESLPPLTGRDFDVLQEVLVQAWCAGFRLREVPIEYLSRKTGRSKARPLGFAFSYLRALKRLWTQRNCATTCDYDARAFSSWVLPQRWWQRRRFALVAALLDDTGRVLDIGCGASQIIRSRPAMIGLDVNAGKLRYLRRTNPLLVRGSAFALPVRSGSMSAVLCSEVIEHIPKSDDLLLEMNRVLEPGGSLVLGTPDYSSRVWCFVEYWYQRLLPNAYADEHISHYTRAELEGLLPRFGFEVSDRRYVLAAELLLKARKVAGAPPNPEDGSSVLVR